ncbi:Nuclear-pore anchor [Spatholobus suberectus]|nr:Nuclear-pore anchor [Spatholobus suberectus]
MMILPLLGLFFWLENKVSNSSEVNHYSKWKELVQISDEINSLFYEQDEENTSAHCACSFCGRLSGIVTRCSRCKTAIYCSNVCHVMHWRFWHKYECVEIEGSEDQQQSPSHGTHYLLVDPENEKHSFKEVEQRRYEGDVYYIEGGESSVVEFSNETAMPQHGVVNGNHGCAVCGHPSSKVCSRCKAIKYCSRTCQHFDWRSGHKFKCLVEKANSNQAATVNQEEPAHGNVVCPTNSYEVEENAHSSSPFSLEFYSGLEHFTLYVHILEATNNAQKEVEEQLSSLKEELAKIIDENISLRSERDEWEARARNSIDILYSFSKENEHQLFILKHENELMSNAEKQARQMVNSLSQRLHYLQMAVDNGVEERHKQEEYIQKLQNECAKAKIELQEQNKCVKRLTLELDKTIGFSVRITEEKRQKLVNAFSEKAAVESNAVDAELSQPISLSRNPTFTRQACSICLTNEKNMTFGCGHMTCTECGTKIRKCHICRKKITIRIKLFPD